MWLRSYAVTPQTYIPTLPSTLGLNTSFCLLIVLYSHSSAFRFSTPSPPLFFSSINGGDCFTELKQRPPHSLPFEKMTRVRRLVHTELGIGMNRRGSKGLKLLRRVPIRVTCCFLQAFSWGCVEYKHSCVALSGRSELTRSLGLCSVQFE